MGSHVNVPGSAADLGVPPVVSLRIGTIHLGGSVLLFRSRLVWGQTTTRLHSLAYSVPIYILLSRRSFVPTFHTALNVLLRWLRYVTWDEDIYRHSMRGVHAYLRF